MVHSRRAERRERRENPDGGAGDRRDGDDRGGRRRGVRAPGGRIHVADWSPLGTFELIAPGEGVPEGLGAVRLFTTGRHTSRERVVTCEPGRVFAYELEAGLPLRDYRAVVTLAPGANGTTINWRSTFRAKVPGTGGLYRRELGSSSARRWRGWRLRPNRLPTRSSSDPDRRWPRPRRRSSRLPPG